MLIRGLLLGVVGLSVIASCSFVDKTTEGEKVRVLSADEVSTCRQIGKTSVSVIAKVAGIERSVSSVQEELNVLARNSAGKYGADTVVPDSAVADGEQAFIMYKCINPNG